MVITTRPTIFLGKKKKEKQKLVLGKKVTIKKKKKPKKKPKEKKKKPKKIITLPPITAKKKEVVKKEPVAPKKEKPVIKKAAPEIKPPTGLLGAIRKALEPFEKELSGEEPLPGVIKGTVPITPAGRAGIVRDAVKGLKLIFKKGGTQTAKRTLVGNTKGFITKGVGTEKSFATNPKTVRTSKSFLTKLGIGIGAAGLLVTAIGSYPFAGFIKEESIQTLNIPIMTALKNNDLEGAAELTRQIDEILNARFSILDKIPFANVLRSLQQFFVAAEAANEEWKRIIEIQLAGREEEPEETFEEGSVRRAEERRQKELEERAKDAEYFALIREGKFDEAKELLEEEMKGGE